MHLPNRHHLAYCTNIHPAESWEDTCAILRRDVLAVRDRLRQSGHLADNAAFAIGLRLSARAARELLEEQDGLARFREWLEKTNTYVFTINGFPYGDFHGTRVKERVFQPDWTTPERLDYTHDLFRILAAIATPEVGGSVSTLPGSHKWFEADESAIRKNLLISANFIDQISQDSGIDLHLGLEPEPFGHFENTKETLTFFEKLLNQAQSPDMVRKRIGLNYDSCHFALQYEDASPSLDAIQQADIRLSKIHISSALAFDPRNPAAIAAVRHFDEPVYFHQTLLRKPDGGIDRIPDLPDFLKSIGMALPSAMEARVHFHIPLDAVPAAPLASTRSHALDTLNWCRKHPDSCQHFEIETYTWAVLPQNMRRPVDQQIAAEYEWVLESLL